MGRKAKSLLTLSVKIAIPDGSNAALVQQYVRAAIISHAGGLDFQTDPLAHLDRESIKVSLLKKEVTYG